MTCGCLESCSSIVCCWVAPPRFWPSRLARTCPCHNCWCRASRCPLRPRLRCRSAPSCKRHLCGGRGDPSLCTGQQGRRSSSVCGHRSDRQRGPGLPQRLAAFRAHRRRNGARNPREPHGCSEYSATPPAGLELIRVIASQPLSQNCRTRERVPSGPFEIISVTEIVARDLQQRVAESDEIAFGGSYAMTVLDPLVVGDLSIPITMTSCQRRNRHCSPWTSRNSELASGFRSRSPVSSPATSG